MSGRPVLDAIGRLASMFPFGELQAETDPASFLSTVVDEICQLRTRAEAAEKRAAALETLAGEMLTHVPEGYLAKRMFAADLRRLSLSAPAAAGATPAPLGSRCHHTSPAGHTCSLPFGHPGSHHGGPQPGYTFR